jgi:hypothetical protein
MKRKGCEYARDFTNSCKKLTTHGNRIIYWGTGEGKKASFLEHIPGHKVSIHRIKWGRLGMLGTRCHASSCSR